MEKKFQYDFSSAEAAANARVLAQALYGRAAFIYAMLVTAASVAVLGIALAGSYLGWWGDYYIAAVMVAAALVLLLSRFVAPRLRRALFRPSHRGGEIEGRAVEYEFDEEGYRIRTQTFEGFQKWAGVDRIIDAKGVRSCSCWASMRTSCRIGCSPPPMQGASFLPGRRQGFRLRRGSEAGSVNAKQNGAPAKGRAEV